MNWRIVIAGFLGALMYAAGLDAATLVEMVDLDGEGARMWFEGAKMRQEAEGGYVLMDWDARKMYLVSLEDGMAMDMSHMLAPKPGGGDGGRGVDASIDKVGDGPRIAGYDTVHYEISVGGEHCRDVFVSAKAMRDMASKDLVERLQQMESSDMEEMDTEWGSPCDHADQAVDFTELGFPLRTVYVESGEVDEVRRIVLDAGTPDGGFEVPAGMQIVDMSQMMQMMQGMPMDE